MTGAIHIGIQFPYDGISMPNLLHVLFTRSTGHLIKLFMPGCTQVIALRFFSVSAWYQTMKSKPWRKVHMTGSTGSLSFERVHYFTIMLDMSQSHNQPVKISKNHIDHFRLVKTMRENLQRFIRILCTFYE